MVIFPEHDKDIMQIHTHKRKTGVLSPKRFINRLKRDNELFRGYMHQVIPACEAETHVAMCRVKCST